MLKSREGKQPPANYYAAILGYLIRAYPNAELTPSLLAQLKPAWDQMWLQGRPADLAAKTTCSCDGKHITLSPAFPFHLPRGAVRAPAGTPRGSLVMPGALRESAGLLRARSQVKRTERMFEKVAGAGDGKASAAIAKLETLREDLARRELEVQELTTRLAQIRKGLAAAEETAEKPSRQPRLAQKPGPKPATKKPAEAAQSAKKRPASAPVAKDKAVTKKPAAPTEKAPSQPNKQGAKAAGVQPSPEDAAMLKAIQGLLPGLATDIAAKLRG